MCVLSIKVPIRKCLETYRVLLVPRLCVDTRGGLKDLPGAMGDRDK